MQFNPDISMDELLLSTITPPADDHRRRRDLLHPCNGCSPPHHGIGSPPLTPPPSVSATAAPVPRRTHSAPPIFTDATETAASLHDTSPDHVSQHSTHPLVRQTLVGIALYVSVGVIFYAARSGSFRGHGTSRLVDGLYFTMVTLCTIGYGDIVPDTELTKLFTSFFILVGFGVVGILLNGLVTYLLDRQETLLLGAMDADADDATATSSRQQNLMFRTYVMDANKGRVRVRLKVALAVGVVAGCIAVGTAMAHVLEGLNWMDSFYLAVTSVTTVGYGDYSFLTTAGRLFAAAWLPVSTLAVARAFLYLTELKIEKRNGRVAGWVLRRKIAHDLVAADLDNNGFISKSEFVIYKLKEMGKVGEKDIMTICEQFDRIDTGKCGKITLSDLIQNHH